MICMDAFLANDWEKYSELRSSWLSLLGSIPHPSPFLDPDLCRLWMESYNPSGSPLAVGVEQSGGLSGLAPLSLNRISRFGIELDRLQFMVSVPWLDSDLLYQSDGEPETTIALDSALDLSGADMVELSGIPVSSATATSLERYASRRGLMFDILYSDSWSSSGINLVGEWPDYLKQRSSKTRYNVRRSTRRVESAGKVGVQRVTAQDNVREVKSIVSEIIQDSWKDPGSYSREGFWTGLVELMHRNDWLDLHVLSISGDPSSFVLLLRYGDTAYAMQTAYVANYSNLSPGIYILTSVLERYFREKPVRRLDFITSYPYLRKLSNYTRGRLKLRLLPLSLRGALLKSFRRYQEMRSDQITRFKSTDDLYSRINSD